MESNSSKDLSKKLTTPKTISGKDCLKKISETTKTGLIITISQ